MTTAQSRQDTVIDRLVFGIAKFRSDERGVTAIEYALLASLIAMVIVLSVGNVGVALKDLWGSVAAAVDAAM